MPNGAISPRAVTTSGRSAASSAAIIPPTEAPITGQGSAPVASSASQKVVIQPRWSSGGTKPETPSKPGTDGTTTSHPSASSARMAGDSSGCPAMPGR